MTKGLKRKMKSVIGIKAEYRVLGTRTSAFSQGNGRMDKKKVRHFVFLWGRGCMSL